jgi:hypothetical protein
VIPNPTKKKEKKKENEALPTSTKEKRTPSKHSVKERKKKVQ